MIRARRRGSPAHEPGNTVIYATFTGRQVSTAAALLAERYRGSGTLFSVTYRDALLRLIPDGGVIQEPMFTMELGDRRLFLQLDAHAKLVYIDDYSLKASR